MLARLNLMFFTVDKLLASGSLTSAILVVEGGVTMVTRKLVGAVGLACSVLMSCQAESESPEHSTTYEASPLRQTLLDGSVPITADPPDATTSSVVHIKGGVRSIEIGCSGIMISPQLVLTAAHCALGSGLENGWNDFPDNPPKVMVLDPSTGAIQTYATGSIVTLLDHPPTRNLSWMSRTTSRS